MRIILVLMFLGALIGAAQDKPVLPVNYDESKVGSYTLPDPLVLANGQPVRDKATWEKKRRPEVLRMFEENMYGRTPSMRTLVTWEVIDEDRQALGGKAIRKQVVIYFAGRSDPHKMTVLIYLPSESKPAPVFLALNFTGNHTILADPTIKLPDLWNGRTKSKQTASEQSRIPSSQWQVEKMLVRGYGLATIYYPDIEPDFPGGIQHGVRPLFFKPGQTAPAPDDWGSIGAWAWGMSRALDYLMTDKDVDAKHVIAMGHSRLGKTTLWAGAQDQRFAMVIAAGSGEGGAALTRRDYGETIRHVNTNFPHWMCGNYKKFSEHVDQLPMDQHMLLALIAPRPLYLAAAEDDRWADPRGEFLSAQAAGPVYKLYGKLGLEGSDMPQLSKPVMNTIGFHIRPGKHEVTAYDWDQFLDFADRNLGKLR